MVEHPVQLGERGAQPDGPLRYFEAHQALDREDDAQFVAERRQPVVPVGQHDDLPVVADLEQLLRAPVHVPDDGFGADQPFAVEDQLEAEHPVRRRVLRPDVEHHVGRFEAGTGADGQLARRW